MNFCVRWTACAMEAMGASEKIDAEGTKRRCSCKGASRAPLAGTGRHRSHTNGLRTLLRSAPAFPVCFARFIVPVEPAGMARRRRPRTVLQFINVAYKCRSRKDRVELCSLWRILPRKNWTKCIIYKNMVDKGWKEEYNSKKIYGGVNDFRCRTDF